MPIVLRGRTVVLATDRPVLASAFTAAMRAAGGFVAVGVPDAATVRTINSHDDPAVIAFAVDLTDFVAWQRILAAAEQRLGPIDGFVIDGGERATVSLGGLAGVDMEARGYGAILTLRGDAPHGVRRATALPAQPAGPDDSALASLAITALADLLG